MRYECEDAAFAGDFVEFSDTWSRAQVRATWATIPNTAAQAGADTEDRLLACLRPKILAIHLTCVDADPITEAGDLTPERTEQIDTRLYEWFSSVWILHLKNLADLGNALGRTLFVFSAPIATMEAALPNLNHS
jgi:hypothetical protein